MELELQYQTLEGYHPIYRSTFGQEETIETIVPDSFPDVARIAYVTGTAYLRDKETSAGTARLNGEILVTVLYIPESAQQVRSLNVSIPFQCVKDCPQIDDTTQVQVTVTSSFSDAKILNPRKLLVRSSFVCSIAAYKKEKAELTSGIKSDETNSIEMAFSQQQCYVISKLVEKPFLFSDVLRQGAAKPEMEELLSYRAHLGAVDGKVIGNKLVCKGEILLTILYRNGTTIVPTRFELPYSQIAEVENVGEGELPDLFLTLKNVNCHLCDHELEVSVEALLQCSIWSTQPVHLMRDAYSIAETLVAEYTPGKLCAKAEKGQRQEIARQFCPSGIPGKQVLDCRAAVNAVRAEDRTCTAEVNVDVLYLSEDDALCGVSYTITASCEIPAHCQCSCRCLGETSAVPVTGGLEVRTTIEFSWMETKEEIVPYVRSLKCTDESANHSERPSIIVRRVCDDETLWDIAKSCRSTIKDICAANSLPTESVESGTILLIPSRKY